MYFFCRRRILFKLLHWGISVTLFICSLFPNCKFYRIKCVGGKELKNCSLNLPPEDRWAHSLAFAFTLVSEADLSHNCSSNIGFRVGSIEFNWLSSFCYLIDMKVSFMLFHKSIKNKAFPYLRYGEIMNKLIFYAERNFDRQHF